MLNQIILVGRIAQTPEPLIVADGKKVIHLHLAVQRGFKNYEGTYDTDFIKVSVWEGLANYLESFMQKGNMIAIKGRVQISKMPLDDEKTISLLEVIAEKVTYLSSPQSKQ